MLEKVIILLESLPALILSFGGKLVLALLIYFLGKWVATGVTKLLKKLLIKSKVDQSLVQFIGNLAYGMIMVFVLIAAIAKLGVQTASFVAIIGAATLAVGMALQGTLANFSAGVMLILFKPFKLGDSVVAAGTTGTVSDIGIFHTIILTNDNRKVIIPNGKLSNDTITNLSALPMRRLEIPLSISGISDIDLVRKVLLDIVASENLALSDPEPKIVLTDANAGSIAFSLQLYTQSEHFSAVHANLLEKIKTTFHEKGIWK